MIHRYAILVLLFVPAATGSQDYGTFSGTIVAQANATSVSVPLPLAQQDAGTTSITIDTHELSKKIGGFAILVLIVVIVILAVRGKKSK